MTSKISRRAFFRVGGLAVGAGAAATVLTPEQAEAAEPRVTLPYKPKPIGKAGGMKVNVPQGFAYPDDASPCVALKMGVAVPGGVGPERDIVAYSILCTHQGCPTAYDTGSRCFRCPCHFTIFDAEKGGQMVSGQAPTNLPRIVLDYDAKTDTVRAVAVEGLIYGRQSNIL
jgi:arsenite oxidase small subunit